jgi:hypothetical protein
VKLYERIDCKQKKGQALPVPSLNHLKFLQTYFAAGASAGAASFFSSFLAFLHFFTFFAFFTLSAFTGAAFCINGVVSGGAAGAVMSPAAITVVQNAKTNATINNAKRFILKSSFLNLFYYITTF